MTPIFQTTFVDDATGERGNCWQCCLASLLHCRLEDVPDARKSAQAAEDGHDWFDVTQAWLRASFGLRLEVHKDVPKGYAIATGPSPRQGAFGHAVIVFDGYLLHDPHPSRAGVLAYETFFTLIPHRIVPGA